MFFSKSKIFLISDFSCWIRSEDLLGVVEHHVKEILLDVFSWHTGEYELVMTEPGSDDVVALNLSTEALITDIPEEEPPAPAGPPGGGMY